MVSSMTGNQVVSTMFDFNTCNHMVRFVFSSDGIEDPGSHLLRSMLQCNMYNLLTHRSTLYVSWLCRLNFNLLA
jgi:hypothetical protein